MRALYLCVVIELSQKSPGACASGPPMLTSSFRQASGSTSKVSISLTNMETRS